jgi:predicted DNA-binding protein (UPF0251 family)
MMVLTDIDAFFEVARALFQGLSDSEELISQAEAARIIGVSRQALTGFIKRGTFSTVSVRGRPLLKRSEVSEYAHRTELKRNHRRRQI